MLLLLACEGRPTSTNELSNATETGFIAGGTSTAVCHYPQGEEAPRWPLTQLTDGFKLPPSPIKSKNRPSEASPEGICEAIEGVDRFLERFVDGEVTAQRGVITPARTLARRLFEGLFEEGPVIEGGPIVEEAPEFISYADPNNPGQQLVIALNDTTKSDQVSKVLSDSLGDILYGESFGTIVAANQIGLIDILLVRDFDPQFDSVSRSEFIKFWGAQSAYRNAGTVQVYVVAEAADGTLTPLAWHVVEGIYPVPGFLDQYYFDDNNDPNEFITAKLVNLSGYGMALTFSPPANTEEDPHGETPAALYYVGPRPVSHTQRWRETRMMAQAAIDRAKQLGFVLDEEKIRNEYDKVTKHISTLKTKTAQVLRLTSVYNNSDEISQYFTQHWIDLTEHQNALKELLETPPDHLLYLSAQLRSLQGYIYQLDLLLTDTINDATDDCYARLASQYGGYGGNKPTPQQVSVPDDYRLR